MKLENRLSTKVPALAQPTSRSGASLPPASAPQPPPRRWPI